MPRLDKITIDHFRSIEHAEIDFPQNTPVVLFGQNNAGKSNLFEAIDIVLGENWPSSRRFEDADFYLRDKSVSIDICAYFSKNDYYAPNNRSVIRELHFRSYSDKLESSSLTNQDGSTLYLKNSDRNSCCFILIDASTGLSQHMSYYSKYSMLSKLMTSFHESLTKDSKVVADLKDQFKKTRDVFEKVPEFKLFSDQLQSGLGGYLKGFDHSLGIDLSAYDPSNYFRSLRIVSKEGSEIRSFDELGTGEQQVLLFSFAHAYAKTFKQSFVLGLEEPESHLHPIAQEWLSRNIEKLCSDGIQVIITTHSPSFLKIKHLEGLSSVTKKEGKTTVKQHSIESFTKYSLNCGANPIKTNIKTILPFYTSTTFSEHMRGFFARKVILVEGPTEYCAVPAYLKNCGLDLLSEGVDVIICGGKGNLGKYYRLFNAYDIDVYVIFDNDRNDNDGTDICKTLKIDLKNLVSDVSKYQVTEHYAYFGGNIESYLRTSIDDYLILEKEVIDKFNVSGDACKPLRAQIIAENYNKAPQFFIDLAAQISKEKLAIPSEIAEDLPF